MHVKTYIKFEPGEKEKLISLMEKNKDKSSLEQQALIKETFNVSMGIASIVVGKYGEIIK